MDRRSTLRTILDEQETRFIPTGALRVARALILSDDMTRAYEIQHELGRGGQGVVYESTVQNNCQFEGFDRPVKSAAIKISKDPESLERERSIYMKPDRGIIKLLDAGSLEVHEHGRLAEKPYLVLEKLFTHPFQNFSVDLDLATAIDSFVNLLDALADIHERKQNSLVLCDIKPENIMIRMSREDGPIDHEEYVKRLALGAYEPVLMDMGCAQDKLTLAHNDGKLGKMIGTPMYLAPEAVPTFSGKSVVPGRYSTKVDVYALTLVFYEYLTRDTIYKHRGLYALKGEEFLLELISFKKEGISPVNPHKLYERFDGKIAKDFEEVLAAGLEPNPRERLSARQLYQLCVKKFQVAERWVQTIGEYRYDSVKGLRVWQTRFRRFDPSRTNRYKRVSDRLLPQ